jgi:hypothetical protein
MQNKKTIKRSRSRILLILILFIITQSSCKKYLEKKPQQNLAIPSSFNDLQAILDNQIGNSSTPGYIEFVADNYYVTSAVWNNADITARTNYIWDRDAITQLEIWYQPYRAIYDANFILDYLPKVAEHESDNNAYNNIKGTALFYRAFTFYHLAQLFCKPYSTLAATDLGIVLRATSAIETPSARSSIQQTYDQVIGDLKTAVELLPVTSLFSTRPIKVAAYGALARVYLSMRDYVNAGRYADSCLSFSSSLLDYNSLTPVGNPALPHFFDNPEVLFVSYIGGEHYFLLPSDCNIDSSLYQSYNANDLRKTVFFGSNGTSHYWKGSYYPEGPVFGNGPEFNGIAKDEIYLIRAECRARAGNTNAAMDDINTLLHKRWKTGTFNDLTATNTTDALNKILTERRKELPFRGLRWSDLRRFNLEGANITLTRIVNNTTYTLPPNDLRWVLLIPDAEIIASGIPQNPR